nr:tRNA lysidine(34) synthetase TilS [Chelativorans petroleitrophicus]
MPDPGALFSPFDFSARKTVVVAVSGGGDSLALLFLLQDYLRKQAHAPSLLAVTVDHGLRAESAEEAHAVGCLVREYGIAHRVLAWQGPKPATRIAEAARRARLALLARAASEAGTDLVLTGHTVDDQAETVTMRLARGEGRGLAGIAPATLYRGGVWFVRPLLATRRQALRMFLKARGIEWIEDPSNRDRRFERSRIRLDLGEEAVPSLLARAREASAAREEAGRRAAAFIAALAEGVAPGLLRLPLADLKGADRESALYVLRILLAVAGGTPHLPDEERTANLLAQTGEGGRTTLSRSVVTCRHGYLHFHRELRNLPRVPLSEEVHWDGRYRLRSRDAAQDLAVAALGQDYAREAEVSGFDAPAELVRAALAAEPGLWKGGARLARATDSPHVACEPILGPWSELLPSFDLAPAEAVGRLIGAPSLPPLPWRSHKKEVG